MKLCECGCGKPAPIANKTRTAQGHVRGEPTRFIHGHHRRGQVNALESRRKTSGPNNWRWKGTAVGYRALHDHLVRHHPKTGVCAKCGTKARTDYALLHGREYSRSRADYRELCRGCHRRYDRAGHPPVENPLPMHLVGDVAA